MAGRQLRKGFKQMQEQMQDQMRAQQGSRSEPGYDFKQNRPTSATKATHQKEDYIDFEEIKEG